MKNHVIANAGFHHIALRASDFEKSFEFYTKGLGFTSCLEWGEGDGRGAMLDMGDGAILELFAGGTGRNDEPAENKKAGRFFHLAITTDNTDAAYEAALAAGAVADRPPCDINIKGKEKELPARIAFVFGPDGEWLEFFQVL